MHDQHAPRFWNVTRLGLLAALLAGFAAFCLWPEPPGGAPPNDVAVSDLRVLEDPDNHGDARTLLAEPEAFSRPAPGRIPQGRGDATLWCLLEVANLGQSGQTLYLSVDNPGADDLVLHVAREGDRLDTARSGDTRAHRPVPEVAGNAIPFSLDPGERVRLLLRSHTEIGSQLLPVRVLDRQGLLESDHAKAFIHGAMLGLLAALLLASALLARSLRDDTYGWYAAYLLCTGMVAAGLTGAGQSTFWSGNVWLSNQGLLLFEAVGKIFLLLFSRRFLEVGSLPGIRRLLGLGLWCAAALAVAVLVLPPLAANRAATAVFLAFPGLTLWAGVSAWRKGRSHAFFYIAGQAVTWLGIWVFLLIDWGRLPGVGLTFEIVPLSICLDALLLNMALADKLTLRHGQTLRLEVEARKTLETRRTELERLVEERTAELARAKDKAEELARTDTLTGAYNRRHMREIGAREFARSLRHALPLCVAVFDVDNFKTVNDTFGHDEGDRVLRAIAGVVAGHVRQQDVFFRWGGEEFLLLLPDTPLDAATSLAERLRREIEATVRAGTEDRPVTASFGVAARQPGDATLSQCITRADTALYEAKACGRNQVSCRLP